MQRILFILSFVLTIQVFGQNPYAEFEYDSLVIYDFEWRGKGTKCRSILDENGNLSPSVKKSVKLSKKEGVELRKKIGDKSSYGQITSACFDPHF